MMLDRAAAIRGDIWTFKHILIWRLALLKKGGISTPLMLKS